MVSFNFEFSHKLLIALRAASRILVIDFLTGVMYSFSAARSIGNVQLVQDLAAGAFS